MNHKVAVAATLWFILGDANVRNSPQLRLHIRELHLRGVLPSDNLEAVSRRFFQLAAGIVLILATLTPFMECFDRWDKNPSPASDTEIHLTAWFVGVGIVLTLAKLLRYVPAFVSSSERPDPVFNVCQAFRLGADDRLEPTGSPPVIPLRI